MGSWELSPGADYCETCDRQGEDGVCPSCGRPLGAKPISSLWPLCYLGVVALLTGVMMPVARKVSPDSARALTVLFLGIELACTVMTAVCAAWAQVSYRRALDKRLLLRVMLTNLALFAAGAVALVVSAL